ncbi:MAG: hypothetical protein HYX39_11180 [Bacteroidetes bacterium]|nr:hypothetical protein [Bacteroidota bacterium]
MLNKSDLFLSKRLDESEAHSDTIVFQSAMFGRYEMLNKSDLFLSKRLDESEAHSDTFCFLSSIIWAI